MFDRNPPPSGIVEPGVGKYVSGEGGIFGWIKSVLLPWSGRHKDDPGDKPPSERV